MRHLFLALCTAAVTVIGSSAAAAPEKQTVWRRAHGAAVIGFDHDRCSLPLYDKESAFIFTWRRSGQTLQAENAGGRFPPGPSIPVAVSIGDTWLGQYAAPRRANLTATGGGSLLSIVLDQPVDPLLAKARQITLRLANLEQQFTIDQGEMASLLEAADRCRRFLR